MISVFLVVATWFAVYSINLLLPDNTIARRHTSLVLLKISIIILLLESCPQGYNIILYLVHIYGRLLHVVMCYIYMYDNVTSYRGRSVFTAQQ